MKSVVTWDEAKRRENLAKHGVDFAIVQDFNFQTAVTDEDRDVRHEQRFQAIGPIKGQLYFLVYTWRGDDIRVISLRRCSKKEARRYVKESQLP